MVDHIADYTVKDFGLIVIDTFTSLYGAKVSRDRGRKDFSVNRELNRQLAILAQSAKIRKIPVVITSQVRSVLDDETASVRPVATSVLKFWADTIIALKPTDIPKRLRRLWRNHRLNTAEVTCYVQIAGKGNSRR